MLKKLKQVRNAVGAAASGDHSGPTSNAPAAALAAGSENAASAEGFLCPMCMVVQSSPEALQKHYEAEHAVSPETEVVQQKQEEEGVGGEERLSEASSVSGRSVSSADQDSGPSSHRDRAGSGAFTCPQCFQELASAEELQSHFSALHELSENRDGDVLAMRMELNDLRSSLKEEKWYSGELKVELERVQSKLMEKSQAMLLAGDVDESTYLQQQIQALEAGKALVTSRMLDLEKEVFEVKRANEQIQREKERIIEKAAYMAKDVVHLKAQVDEENSQKVALGEEVVSLKKKVGTLEKSLDQRPSEDDVDVLRKELVHAQTLMDTLNQEKDKEIQAWTARCQQMEIKSAECDRTINLLTEQLKSAAKTDDIQKLQTSVQESSERVQKDLADKNLWTAQMAELQKELNDSLKKSESVESELKDTVKARADTDALLMETRNELKDSLDKVQALENINAEVSARRQKIEEELSSLKEEHEKLGERLSRKEQEFSDIQKKAVEEADDFHRQVAELRAQVGTLQQQIKDQNTIIEELSGKVRDSESEVIKLREELGLKETSAEELLSELEALKDHNSRLDKEKRDMISKIQEGQGNLAALSSLSDEKTSLLSQLEKSFSDIRALKQRHKEEIQGNKKQIQEKDAVIFNMNEKLEQVLKQFETSEMSRHKSDSRMQRLQAEIISAQNQLEACEKTKEMHRKDLEGHIQTLMKSGKERADEALQLMQQNESLIEEVSGKREKIARLEATIAEERVNLQSAIEKLEEAEKKAAETSQQLQIACEVRKELETGAETLRRELEAAKKQLQEKEAKLEKEAAECESLTNRNEKLNWEWGKTENSLKLAQEQYSQLESSCALSEEGQLQKITEIQQGYEQRLTETYSEREKLCAQLRQAEKELEKEKDSFFNFKSNSEQTLKAKDVELDTMRTSIQESEQRLSSAFGKMSMMETESLKLREVLAGTEAKCKSFGVELKKLREELKDSRNIEKVLSGKLEALQEQTNNLISEKDSLVFEKNELFGSMDAKNLELEDAKAHRSHVEEELAKFRDESVVTVENLDGRIKEWEAACEDKSSLCQKLGKEVERLEESLSQLQTENEKLAIELSESALSLKELQKKNQELEQQCQESQEQCLSLTAEMSGKEEEWEGISEKLIEKQNILQNELLESREMNGDLEKKMAELERSLKESEQHFLDQMDKQTLLLESQRAEFETQLVCLSGAADESNAKLASATEQLSKVSNELRMAYEEVTETKNALEEERSNAASDKAELLAVRHKLEEKSEWGSELSRRKASLETSLQEKEGVIADLTMNYQRTVQSSSEELRQISEKTSSLLAEKEALESCLEKTSAERNELEVLLGDAKEEKMQLEERVMLEEKEFMIRMTESTTEQEKIQKSAESVQRELENNLQTLASKLDGVVTELTSKKEEVLAAQDLNAELKEKFSELQAKNVEGEEKMQKLEFQLRDERKRVGAMTAESENFRSLDEQKTREIQQHKGKIEELTVKLTEVNHEIRSLRDELESKMKEIEKLSSYVSDSELKRETVEKAVREKSEAADNFAQEVRSCEQRIEEMNVTVEQLHQSLDSATAMSSKLEAELADRDKAFEEIMAAKISLEQKLTATQSEADETGKQLEQLASDSKKREQGFMDHVKDLKRQLEKSQKDAEQAQNEVKQYQEASRTLKADSDERLANVQKELEWERSCKAESEKTLSGKLWDVENQNQLLADSLGEIRSELDQNRRMLEETSKQCSHLESEKNDLEIQITAWNEEKRAMLERCLNTERDLEEEKEKSDAVKKRFDDALSAMHELGREHLSMQVDLSKVFNRKWVGDAEAVNCTACGKIFSVTVRKHHCRNCGLIFCSDCSSKQASMASSKRPVRVCDGCHQELISR